MLLILFSYNVSSGHPFFLGLQAHPEFCTRPLNPSPPFLGFVAAACGPEVFTKQLERLEKEYVPPHPAASMVSEEQLRNVVGAVPPTASGKEHMQVVQAVNQDF